MLENEDIEKPLNQIHASSASPSTSTLSSAVGSKKSVENNFNTTDKSKRFENRLSLSLDPSFNLFETDQRHRSLLVNYSKGIRSNYDEGAFQPDDIDISLPYTNHKKKQQHRNHNPNNSLSRSNSITSRSSSSISGTSTPHSFGMIPSPSVSTEFLYSPYAGVLPPFTSPEVSVSTPDSLHHHTSESSDYVYLPPFFAPFDAKPKQTRTTFWGEKGGGGGSGVVLSSSSFTDPSSTCSLQTSYSDTGIGSQRRKRRAQSGERSVRSVSELDDVPFRPLHSPLPATFNMFSHEPRTDSSSAYTRRVPSSVPSPVPSPAPSPVPSSVPSSVSPAHTGPRPQGHRSSGASFALPCTAYYQVPFKQANKRYSTKFMYIREPSFTFQPTTSVSEYQRKYMDRRDYSELVAEHTHTPDGVPIQCGAPLRSISSKFMDLPARRRRTDQLLSTWK